MSVNIYRIGTRHKKLELSCTLLESSETDIHIDIVKIAARGNWDRKNCMDTSPIRMDFKKNNG